MSAQRTRDKIIRIIVQHYLDGGRGKLTIQGLSAQAGITRQSLQRYYEDLFPYVRGERPVEELIKTGPDDFREMLATCLGRIRELQQELERFRTEYDAAVESVHTTYITTLMGGDIALKNSDEIRSTLEKQALHNEKLAKEVQRLQLELTAAKGRETWSSARASHTLHPDTEIIPIEPNLADAFRNYMRTKDREAFEDKKDSAIEHMQKKINKLCQGNDSVVILFIDRYLSSFSKFVDSIRVKQRSGKAIVARTPIFNRLELKLFSKKFNAGASIFVHVPYCINESVVTAQRKFTFRDIPDVEFDSADKMANPTTQDGYDELVFLRVEQGD